MQIVDMDVGRVADSNLTTGVEVPSTGGIGVMIIVMGVNVGALHVGWLVMGDRDHGGPTFMVWMTNSNYGMGPRSTGAGMPRLENRNVVRLRNNVL